MPGGKTQDVDVDLVLTGNQLKAAFDSIDARIAAITKSVAAVGVIAGQSAAKFNEQLNSNLKGLAKREALLRGAQAVVDRNNQRTVNDTLANKNLASRTRQATIYARTLNNAGTAAEAFQAKLNKLDRKIATAGNNNSLAYNRDLSKRLGTEKAMQDLRVPRLHLAIPSR